MPSELKLSDVLSEFARTMVTDFPIQGILDRLVLRIVDILPITGAGVTLIAPGVGPRYVAASNEPALRFEQMQTELNEGPCVLAFQTGEAVSAPNLREDRRFPAFGPQALAAGLEAAFTFPLRDGEARMGALDLYRDTPGPLDAGTMAAAQTLADVAAAYLLNAQARTDLQTSTDRSRQSESEQGRLAAQLATAQRLAGIGSWEWDIIADTLWWSDELCRICGIELGDAPRTYAGYLATIHPEDRPLADAAIKRGMATAEPFGFDHRVVHADGSVRVIRARGGVTVSDAGVALCAVGTSQDVTDLEMTIEALRKSEGRLAEAQSIGRVGSWEWDVAADRVTWSDELNRLFGVELPNLPTTYLGYLGHVHPEDQDLARSTIEAAFKSGDVFDFDHRVVVPERPVRWIHSRGEIERDDDGMPMLMRGTAADITDRVELQHELAEFALVDGLTGLYNRRGFVTLAEHFFKVAARAGRSMAMLFIDMDGMKGINDAHGHREGDRALVEVATYLTTTLRSSDLLARVGGDEFCVLMFDDRSGAGIGVDRVVAALRTPPAPVERSHGWTLSVGVARHEAGSGTSVEELMSHADEAMYEDKRSRRRLGRVLFVDDDAALRALTMLKLAAKFDVTAVATGSAALTAVAEQVPDLLLLDLSLPDMHGTELLRRVRAFPGGDRVSVIVVTASTGGTHEIQSLQQGVDDFIAKPFKFDVLQVRMSNVLGRSSPRT